jgi:hypothetical protein
LAGCRQSDTEQDVEACPVDCYCDIGEIIRFVGTRQLHEHVVKGLNRFVPFELAATTFDPFSC